MYATTQNSDQTRVAIGASVQAIGGLAIRLEDWSFVQHAALLPSGWRLESREEEFLVPDARLRGARSNLLPGNGTLIGLSLDWARGTDMGRPDLPSSDDRILDSICQFNAVATLVQFEISRDWSFPEFRYYESRRTDPLFQSLVRNSSVRRVLLPNVDERGLAQMLVDVARVNREHFVMRGVWDGYARTVERFIQANATPRA